MNKIKTTAIATALASALGGSVYVGSEVSKPECDFIIANQAQEICLSQEQAEALLTAFESPTAGFGGIKFGGEAPIVVPK